MALENLRSAGYEGSADLLVGDGLEGLDALLRYERFDLVYLDADVSREEVEESIRRGWALLKPGGYLLVDDVDYTSEVGRAFEGQRGRFQDAQFTQRLGTFRGLGVMRKMPAACPPEQAVEHACAVCDGELTRMPDHDGMRLLRCVGCHLIQVDLSDPEVRGAWAGYYTESGAYHRERQLAGHESFLHRYLHDRELGRLRIENLLRYAEPGRLLDVGCSNGALVREAAEAGFDAEGIDVDPWVVHEGARLSGCRLAACNPLAWEGGPYDVITVIDVFEHFPTPREHLAKLRNLLKPGGLLVLEMPDAGQGGVERLGVAWRHFKPREHAFLYAKEHTHRLLAEGGFEVVDSVVPYPDRRVDYARRV